MNLESVWRTGTTMIEERNRKKLIVGRKRKNGKGGLLQLGIRFRRIQDCNYM